MLPIVEKEIRGSICQSALRFARADNNYMKNYDENKDSWYLTYLYKNNLSGWIMSQNLPVDQFKLVKGTIIT